MTDTVHRLNEGYLPNIKESLVAVLNANTDIDLPSGCRVLQRSDGMVYTANEGAWTCCLRAATLFTTDSHDALGAVVTPVGIAEGRIRSKLLEQINDIERKTPRSKDYLRA